MQNGQRAENRILISGCSRGYAARTGGAESFTAAGYGRKAALTRYAGRSRNASDTAVLLSVLRSKKVRSSVGIFAAVLTGILLIFGLVGAAETGSIPFPAACSVCIILLGGAACWLYYRYGFEG